MKVYSSNKLNGCMCCFRMSGSRAIHVASQTARVVATVENIF